MPGNLSRDPAEWLREQFEFECFVRYVRAASREAFHKQTGKVAR
jgi:hypothetical protein